MSVEELLDLLESANPWIGGFDPVKAQQLIDTHLIPEAAPTAPNTPRESPAASDDAAAKIKRRDELRRKAGK